MITYVDTSTLIKLFIDEAGSAHAQDVWDASDVRASSRLVVVESRAALAAAARAGRLGRAQHRAAKRELAALIDHLTLVEVTGELIADAAGMAEVERLRGYDAVHLASALLVEAEVFTSADTALCEAAWRRGMHVANPLDG